MIFENDYLDAIKGFFTWVSESAAIMMVLSGLIAITWLGYERKRRGSFTKKKVEEAEEKKEISVTKFLRGLSYLGLILGVFVVWSGVVSLIMDIPPSFQYRDETEDHVNYFTSIFLIVIGIVMFMKPIADLPLAGILGLIAGTATALIVALLVPDEGIQIVGGYLSRKWLLVIIFIVVTAIVALTTKFYIGLLKTISKILSWPPIAFIIMIFCFVQGFALWGFGLSVVGPYPA